MPKGSGRRPLPTAVKKLRGNPGKRKLNAAEPTAPAGEPQMPPGLGKEAAAEWKRIVPDLSALGVLSRIDGKALAAYCHAFDRWMQAEKEVKRYGIVVKEPVLLQGEPTGFVRHKKNPAVTVSETAMKLMKSFLIEFGMTPAARSRIRIEKPSSEDPQESYVRRKLEAAKGSQSVN
jgi:P27 family predicted phage terminase small subunit